ncbi:MAG TPA: bifunctional [glutamine synthetase] adenylyltransferase/[glutamine synthetase]-adenylyl-L-tyrosine phosphorylase [Acidimicrobiales bacterium]|nr:bifunctional [glutamine synthetase] adenylyltransferase/[glutamine synthetase]-adenylyl-L-tyrosine phosphorylase [Acidimicrobiales bacterium]
MGASSLRDRVARSADPERARTVADRLREARPGDLERLLADDDLAEAVVAVAAGSRWLGRLVVTDPAALDVLAALDRRVPFAASDPGGLARWRHHEHLRLAARDLTGRDPVEATMAGVTAMAATVLEGALDQAGAGSLAVIGMGKAGGTELNYASDVDVVLVGPTGGPPEAEAARRFLDVAGAALRIDLDLRPEGRDGPLVRSLAGYRAHWERWAEPWERQALLKAQPLAGDPTLGQAFAAAAGQVLWDRPFDAEALHQVRALKARAEQAALARRGAAGEIKRSPGGIRDVEFAAQLLQLVHGPHDPALRVRGTLPALAGLAAGGYVADDDARWLAASYRFLRRVEHALQLDEDRRTHTVPTGRAERARVARVLGLADRPRTSALDELDRELGACRATVRAIHERVWFRPLLEAFTGVGAPLAPEAAATRLRAFGFADAERTRQAVTELTHGLTRSSRLMAQMLPLVLDWLSTSPDPDRGLLGLRQLAAADARSLAAAFRESPVTAHRVCTLAGTSPSLVRELARAPDALPTVGRAEALAALLAEDPGTRVARAMALRADGDGAGPAVLHRTVRREVLAVAAHDVLDDAPVAVVGRALATVARAAVEAAVALAAPEVPFAVLAAGRLAGGELGYASDLDLLFVHDGEGEAATAEASRVAEAVRRALVGTTPGERIYDVDLDLRPGGRSAPLARSRASVVAHLERWAEPWERLALSRARPLAGHHDLAARVLAEVEPALWRPLGPGDLRAIRRVKARAEAERIPAGEDPTFHLKLGPGALADVELTVALLLLRHGCREAGTAAGLDRLRADGLLDEDEAAALGTAHDFCERARNRWTLVAGRGHDALPTGAALTTLARSLDTTAPELRDRYRRLTRRARQVVERRFYEQPA